MEASCGGASSGGALAAALGSGAFGKVGTYRYHGAAVAVKELKTGVDSENIGTVFWLLLFQNCLSLVVVPSTPVFLFSSMVFLPQKTK